MPLWKEGKQFIENFEKIMVISLINLYFGLLSVNSVRKSYIADLNHFDLFPAIFYLLSSLSSVSRQNVKNMCLFLLKSPSSIRSDSASCR